VRPLAEFPEQSRRGLRIVLGDIDDTMTMDGRLPSTSLAAMERLQAAGLLVVPVTGRPAGWCDHIARMWPVDAVIGENGAFWFSYDRTTRSMRKGFAKSESERKSDHKKLKILKKHILSHVSGAALATDQFCRISDLAIDFCEDVERLPPEEVDYIVELFETAGATAKVSSIHVNGWFGSFDKLSMTRTCLTEVFDINANHENASCLFIGDSPNDQPMFAFFENSVGVANVRDFDLASPPAWVTHARAAEGFTELADRLVGG
jgi:HAD superfamily hydrolase (TIGR01484 family)